jgi:hypothetical protein
MRQAAVRNPFVNNTGRLAGGGSACITPFLAGHTPALKVAGVRKAGTQIGKRSFSTDGDTQPTSSKRMRTDETDLNDQPAVSRTTPLSPTPFNSTPILRSLSNNSSSGVFSIVSTDSCSSPHPGKENIDPKARVEQNKGDSNSTAATEEEGLSGGSFIDLTSEQLEELSVEDPSTVRKMLVQQVLNTRSRVVD